MSLKRNKVMSYVLLAILVFSQFGPLQADTLINAGGATLPYPVYSKWCDEYHKLNPSVRINYQPIGSGGGIRQFSDKILDFGATDSPLSQREQSKIQGGFLFLPTVLGGVVPAFNVEGIQDLNFTGDVLAEIYLGNIKSWDDKAIKQLNPNVALPKKPITVVHRSDGSGTTYCFTDYLTAISPEWDRVVGRGESVNWPTGIGAKGNEGVAGMVRTNPYSIGYMELIFAKQNRIAYGAVKNKAGKFIKADVESIKAAGASAKMPEDFRLSIVNASGEKSYPISTFTWLLLNEKNRAGSGPVLREFLEWTMTKGQALATQLDYAPLPADVVPMVQKHLTRIQ